MFKMNYNKPGKGINKDEPQKKGFALFFDILLREFWAIIGLNLLFILASIPIFTIGASYAALNNVIIKMVRDVPVDVIPDFKKAFKDNFKQGTVVFFINAVIFYLIFIAYNFYAGTSQLMAYIVLGISFMLIMLNNYVYPLLSTVDLKIKNIYKNSFLLSAICMKQSLPALLLLIFAMFMWFILLPISMIYIFFIGISLAVFVNCFLTFVGIKKFVIGENNQPENE